MKIIGISGSLRAASLNTALLKVAGSLVAAEGSTLEIVGIGALPLYDADLDGDDKPAPVRTLLDALGSADALLFATPEYNYGISGALKNAIDWASRPAYASVLTGTPCGMLSASPSTLGGARAQAQLREVLSGTLSPVYPAPDFLLAAAHKAFDEHGALSDAKTREFLHKYVSGFLAWAGSARHA